MATTVVCVCAPALNDLLNTMGHAACQLFTHLY